MCGGCGRLELYATEPSRLLEVATPAAEKEAAAEDTCLRCGAHMPAEVSQCPACGWSYSEGGPG
jgi:ribosomal protein L40E